MSESRCIGARASGVAVRVDDPLASTAQLAGRQSRSVDKGDGRLLTRTASAYALARPIGVDHRPIAADPAIKFCLR